MRPTVSVRRIGWKVIQPQLSVQSLDKDFCFLRDMSGSTINNQNNWALGARDQALQKFDEYLGVDPALLLDYEPHVTSCGYR
jgi:hypothetical protein